MLHKQLLSLSILIMFTVACGPNPTDDGGSAPGFRLYGGIGSEKAYCSPIAVSTAATTVSSTAQYRYRAVDSSVGLTTPGTANIRYAEVQILDSNGSTIQCGETDASGAINLTMPRVAGNYTLKVFSRADNNFVKASILNNPTSMEPYAISSDFTLDGTEATASVALTPADYRNTLEGGAFNILDQIYKVNQYIRTNSTCSSLGGICTLYTVAPKVRVFWKPGLSPGAYFEEPTASISFFTPNDDQAYGMATGIYMMGGINDDVCVDTDHFDNSVIIHEYGHFLEKAFADSDSPGGSHNGNSVIDPRLAWSEGWANFLQGAVMSESRYVDTKGNSDCSGGTGINVNLNLERIVNGQDTVLEGTTFVGEGIFREVSVSRALWDLMTAKGTVSSTSDGKGAELGFSAIWKVFSDPTIGFRNSGIHFRNIGHFNEIMRSIVNMYANSKLTDFDAVISNEAQRSDRREYGLVLSPTSSTSCGEYSLTAVAGVNNYARTNDFFAYYYDGSAANSVLTMNYSASSGTPSDLDMYVWNEEHTIGNTADLAASSAGYYPEAGGPTGLESVSLAGRPAGFYLIQIQADPDSAANASNYYIETSGAKRLCP